jgi:predicted AAA+ superfamily ATPase
MFRHVTGVLKEWRDSKEPRALILRGARQVGKTYVVEDFGKNHFDHFVKINFEIEHEYKKLFEHLQVKEIIQTISIQKNKDFIRGKTLLFLDEIQECPKALQALRYFYEDLPGLHVIAAGSLLEFIINSEDFKFPAGRVEFLYLGPMSFEEFLLARSKEKLNAYIKELSLKSSANEVLHKALLDEFKTYILVGGMPKAISEYIKHEEELDGGLKEAFKVQDALLQAYKNDFGKYAKASKHADMVAILDYIPQALSRKFKYAHVYPEAKTIALKQAFDLLVQAGIIIKVRKSPANIPLAAGVSNKHFKAILLDVGLAMALYDMDIADLMSPVFWEKISGAISEQVVGQEILASLENHKEPNLYYWERESHQSSAEIDYLLKVAGEVVPVEVKSGLTGRLKSLHLFLAEKQKPLGVRVSSKQLYLENKILSVPIYATSEISRLVQSIKK